MMFVHLTTPSYRLTGVVTNRQEEAVASSCFDWPIVNDKDFANGLRKFNC